MKTRKLGARPELSRSFWCELAEATCRGVGVDMFARMNSRLWLHRLWDGVRQQRTGWSRWLERFLRRVLR